MPSLLHAVVEGAGGWLAEDCIDCMASSPIAPPFGLQGGAPPTSESEGPGSIPGYRLVDGFYTDDIGVTHAIARYGLLLPASVILSKQNNRRFDCYRIPSELPLQLYLFLLKSRRFYI